MRAAILVVLTILIATPGAAAGPIEDLEKELATVEGKLIELTMNSLEARFARPGGPVFALYDIADLTVPLTEFIAPNIRVKPAGSEFDEDQPQFGTIREGPTFFDADDLAEILRSNIRPAIWDAGGTLEVRGTILAASAPDGVQAEIRETLRSLRANLGRIVTVQVFAIEADLTKLPLGPVASAECDALLAKLEREEGGRILAGAEVSGYAGQRIMVFDGRQRSFVQDLDVEVAQNSKIPDPIVSILQDGLCFSVRALPQGSGQGVLLDLQADYSRPVGEMRIVKTTVGPVQLPHLREARAHATVTVPDAGGLLFGGASSTGKAGGRIAFLTRARVTSVEPKKLTTAPDRVDALTRRIASRKRLIAAYERAIAERGALFRMQLYAVNDLLFAPRDYPGPTIGLTPSGAGGFEDAEEYEEAIEYFEPEQLVQMIRTNVAPGSWEELLTTNIEISGKNLVVTHTPGVHARIGEFLRRLRTHASRLISLDVQVIGISDADRRTLGAAGPFLDADAGRRLEAWVAEGRVQRMHSGRILARSNQRVALTDLEPVCYVYDYDVEIAQDASISDPLIQRIDQGLVVDARPVVAGGGSHVVMEVRMRRLILTGEKMAKLDTEVGTIETPLGEYTQMGCTLSCPVGATASVGGGLTPRGAAGQTRRPLVLVTPRILTVRGK